MTTEEQLVDAWRISNRVNIYLLDSLTPEMLGDIAASKGRSVGEQFAHLHNVRLMWLQSAAKELLAGLEKIEKENAGDTGLLRNSLEASASAVERLLEQSFASGKVKGFKPHPAAFVGYLLAHEAHHRGTILLALKQSGHPVDKKVAYGMWEWGVR